MCDGLELEVNPFAQAVWQATHVRTDRAGWVVAIDGGFMDFVGHVELSKWGVTILVDVIFYVV